VLILLKKILKEILNLNAIKFFFGKMLSGVRLDHIACAVRKVSDGFRLIRRLRGKALKGKSLQVPELICSKKMN
jgi:hypothetical protein